MRVRKGTHGVAIEVKDIEDDQRRGLRGRQMSGGMFVRCRQAPAQALELGSASGVEADELAVEQDVASSERCGERDPSARRAWRGSAQVSRAAALGSLGRSSIGAAPSHASTSLRSLVTDFRHSGLPVRG